MGPRLGQLRAYFSQAVPFVPPEAAAIQAFIDPGLVTFMNIMTFSRDLL